jgi:fructosamine-3-kinase
MRTFFESSWAFNTAPFRSLFGGYPQDFYAAYRAAYPLDSGYATRRELYNLYHILNHANLFGGGYARQAEQMMQRLQSRSNIGLGYGMT